MAKWRPEEWDAYAIQGRVLKNTKIGDHNDIGFIEAGADAMLEALRKRGLHLPGNILTDNAEGLVRIPLALKNVPQTIVIIPDEEVSSFPLICGSCGTRHSPEEACPQRE